MGFSKNKLHIGIYFVYFLCLIILLCYYIFSYLNRSMVNIILFLFKKKLFGQIIQQYMYPIEIDGNVLALSPK